MAKRADVERLQELVEASKGESTKHAAEVLSQLYEAILKTPTMTLTDGTTASVEAYYPPQQDEGGQGHCGIDIRLASGDVLEFTVRNTGWARSFLTRCTKHADGQRRR